MAVATLVSVSDIAHRPGTRKPIRLTAPVAGLALSGTVVPEGEEVDLDLVLESVAEGILARGRVAVGWESECRRCLTRVSGEVNVDVAELFEERPTDTESYVVRHEQVDLEPLAREAILLELPRAPLCRPDCAGLCPTCGADRNDEPCGCPESEGDGRWAKLDLLRFDAD